MKQLEQALDQLNIPHSPEIINKFSKYMEEILIWNEKVNLTAITDRMDFVKKHFIDSIICRNFVEFTAAQRIIDVGTGAGFPGVPLALVATDKEFLLMDSLGKRVKILNEICIGLDIKNVKTLHGRAEDVAQKKEYREGYDLCVSRAVANLSTLSEYCLPFVKKGGYFLAYKGPDYIKEVKEGSNAIRALGGRIAEVKSVVLKDFDLEHNIICIEKVSSTPTKYPRKAGTPSKEPLK